MTIQEKDTWVLADVSGAKKPPHGMLSIEICFNQLHQCFTRN